MEVLAFYDELIAYVDHKVKRRELGLNKQKISNLLAWCKEQGKLISGEEHVIKAIQEEKAKLVFLAMMQL